MSWRNIYTENRNILDVPNRTYQGNVIGPRTHLLKYSLLR